MEHYGMLQGRRFADVKTSFGVRQLALGYLASSCGERLVASHGEGRHAIRARRLLGYEIPEEGIAARECWKSPIRRQSRCEIIADRLGRIGRPDVSPPRLPDSHTDQSFGYDKLSLLSG